MPLLRVCQPLASTGFGVQPKFLHPVPGTHPEATFSPYSLNFGTVAIGPEVTADVTVRSTGTTALDISKIGVTGADGSNFKPTGHCPSSLAPSDSAPSRSRSRPAPRVLAPPPSRSRTTSVRVARTTFRFQERKANRKWTGSRVARAVARWSQAKPRPVQFFRDLGLELLG